MFLELLFYFVAQVGLTHTSEWREGLVECCF